jgi:outer membrane protein OmpA-like peptidoglycan-associated protein
MKLRLCLLLVSVCWLFLTGCPVAVIGLGIGAGAGTYAYVNGELIRDYESEYNRTVESSVSGLKKLGFKISDVTTGKSESIVKASDSQGTPVVVKVDRLDPNHTKVSVRAGVVGYWNKETSSKIQESIQKELGISASGATAPKQETEKSDQAESRNRKKPKSSGTISAKQKAETSRSQVVQDSKDRIRIAFRHRSNDLTPEAMQKLDEVAEYMSANPNVAAVIRGYTDSLGDYNYNVMVAGFRAETVKMYLVGKGIAVSRITAVGIGPKDFIASNDTFEGRALNRRVEIEY